MTLHRSIPILLLLLTTDFAPSAAHAACTSPAAIEGEQVYNSDYATMQFCDGTNWVSMAASGAMTESDPQVGALTANNFCTSNAGGTAIVCATAAIPISSISATGTPSATTYLRGDGTWATPAGGGGAPTGAAGGDLTGTYPNPSIGAGRVTNAMLAGSIDLTTKMTGILPVPNGGTGTATGSITGTGALTFTAGGTNQNVTLTPSGTGYTLLNGNVGIGITAPGSPLDIRSSASTGSALYIDAGASGSQLAQFVRTNGASASVAINASGGDPQIVFGRNNSNEFALGDANGAFKLSAGNVVGTNDLVTVTSSGNVGIGTTAPTRALHIKNSSGSAITALAGTATTYAEHEYLDEADNVKWSTGVYGDSHATAALRNAFYIYQYKNQLDATINTHRVFISDAGNMGIGTSAPASQLHVYNAAADATIKSENNGGNVAQLVLKNTTAGGREYAVRSWGAAYSGQFAIDDLTANLRRFTITSTGDVGIGTDAPSEKLDVVSGSIGVALATATMPGGVAYGPSSQNFNYTNASGTYKLNHYGITVTAYPSSAATYLSGYGELGLFSGGANRLHITSTGNVGIGTTAPGSILDINGALTVREMAAPAVSPVGQGRIYFDATANVFKVSENGGAYTNLLGGGTAAASGVTGAVQFSNGTALTSDAANFFWDDTNNRLGIGSTTPVSALEVVGAITAGTNVSSCAGVDIIQGRYGSGPISVMGALYSSCNTFMGYGVKANTAAGGYLSSTSVALPRAVVEAGATGIMFSTGASQTVAVNGAITLSEVMRISTNGNVGIGTTTPGLPLDVYGALALGVPATVQMRATDTTSAAQDVGASLLLAGYHTAQTGLANFAAVKGGKENATVGNFASYLALFTRPSGSALAERMRITSTGNVGIGTTGPDSKLNVVGDVEIDGANQTSLRAYASAKDGAQLSYYAAQNFPTASAYYRSLDIVAPSFNTSSIIRFLNTKDGAGGAPSESMRIDNTGNVGIGTTAPAGALDVNSGASSETAMVLRDGMNANYPDIYCKNNAGANTLCEFRSGIYNNGGTFYNQNMLVQRMAIIDDTNAALTISGGTSGYTYFSGGNVGVGTAVPAYKLDVAGTLHASGAVTFDSTVSWGSGARTETRNDAGLQGNAGAMSGSFETASPVNYPAGASSWWHLLDVRHTNSTNNYAMQIAGSFFDQNIYFRKTNGAATTSWSQLLATNGNGSALTNLNASNLATGTVPTARLGSGTANATTYLRGDGTWAAPAGGGGGSTATDIQTKTTTQRDAMSPTTGVIIYNTTNARLEWFNGTGWRYFIASDGDAACQDPYWSYVKLLMHFDGANGSTAITDLFAHSLTVGGNAQLSTAQSKFGGASAVFDGAGDYVSFADAADLEPKSADFTIEFWFRANVVSGTQLLPSKYNYGGYGPLNFLLSGTSIVIYASSGGGWDIAGGTTIATGIAANTWYHFAFVRNGTAMKTYINGVYTGYTITTSLPIADDTTSWRMGASPNYDYNGYIEELRLTIGAARYTSNFTPPAAAFPTCN